MTKITPALISCILLTFSPASLIAQDEACLGISRDTINWLSFLGGEGPADGLAVFQSDPADWATVHIDRMRERTLFRDGYPSQVTNGSDLTGWDIVNDNNANDGVQFPLVEYSMRNDADDDGVQLLIEYNFANPLPSGSVIVVGKFNWQRNVGLRTRAIATAYDNEGNALPPTTLVAVENYNFSGRTGVDSLAWNMDYDDITGEFAHEKPGQLPSFAEMDTDWLLVTTVAPISRIEFDVTESPCDASGDSFPFRIGIGKPAFATRGGKFHGLINNADPTTFNTGSGLLRVNNKGGFSARFRFDGVAYRFGGQFNAVGNDWSSTVTSRDGPAVDVAMKFGADYTGLGLAVNGTIAGAPGNSTFSLMFSPYASGCALPLDIGGPYTALVDNPAIASDDLPAGKCYAMGSVKENGHAGFYIRTTGNVIGYAGGYLNRLNEFAFQANAHTLRSNNRRQDTIIGTVVFEDLAGASDFNGTVTLYKSDDTRYRNYYPSGYEYEASIIGSHYFPPAPGDVNISDIMVDGLSLNDFFSLDNKKANFSAEGSYKRVRFSPVTGEISGQYRNMSSFLTPRWRAFGGVLFQKSDGGGGWALGLVPRNSTGKIGLFLINDEPEIVILPEAQVKKTRRKF